MKYIKKNIEGLRNLEQWEKKKFPHGISKKKTPDEIWSNFKKYQSDIYKESKVMLLKEQGYLCAYCGRVIGKIEADIIVAQIDKLKTLLAQKEEEYDAQTIEMALFAGDFQAIEHIVSKGKERSMMFNYHNLVAVCQGGKGTDDEHCDVAKWDKWIKIKPTDADCESYFRYENGEIKGENQQAMDTIDTLNLNAKRLKIGRRIVTDSEAQTFVEELVTLGTEAEDIKILIQDKIQEIYSKPKLDPYCFVKVYYFRTYLS